MNKPIKRNVIKLALLLALLCSCIALISCSQPAEDQKVTAIAPAGMDAKRASAAILETERPLQGNDAIITSPAPEPTAESSAPEPTPSRATPSDSPPDSDDAGQEEGVCAVDFAGQGKKMGDFWVFQSFDGGLVGEEYFFVSLIHVGNEAGELLWSLDITAPITELLTISDAFPCRDMLYIQVDGDLFAYDMLTGEERFVAPGVGASISYGFGPDDILYISGYYGPLLTAVSPEGEMLWRIESAQLDDLDFVWPQQVEVLEDNIKVLGESDSEPLLLISDFSGNYSVEKKYPGESHIYIAEDHGFSLALPSTWDGHYNIISADYGLLFEYLYSAAEGAQETALYMFSVSDDPSKAYDGEYLEIGEAGGRAFYYLLEREPELDALSPADEAESIDSIAHHQMQSMMADAHYITLSFEAAD
ncbi:MAG: hypothetical protein ACOX8S_02140 [Christensenellales bacterium]